MTVINNSINNMFRISTENTILSSPTVDQISAKILASITSVRNVSPSMNRHGNTFQGMIIAPNTTRPGVIKNIYSAVTPQNTAVKTPLYNPLNRHGNTFQGMITTPNATRPGVIKNIYSAVTPQNTAAKTPLYNPLNRHGNTFQGMITTPNTTLPGAIKNIHSAAGSAIDKTIATPENNATLIKTVDLANPRL